MIASLTGSLLAAGLAVSAALLLAFEPP